MKDTEKFISFPDDFYKRPHPLREGIKTSELPISTVTLLNRDLPHYQWVYPIPETPEEIDNHIGMRISVIDNPRHGGYQILLLDNIVLNVETPAEVTELINKNLIGD